MYLRTLVSVWFLIPLKLDPASPWQDTSARSKPSLHLLYPGEIALFAPCIGGWLGPRVGLEMVGKKKVIPFQESNSCRPISSQSFY
jgi:hypothetical protein